MINKRGVNDGLSRMDDRIKDTSDLQLAMLSQEFGFNLEEPFRMEESRAAELYSNEGPSKKKKDDFRLSVKEGLRDILKNEVCVFSTWILIFDMTFHFSIQAFI